MFFYFLLTQKLAETEDFVGKVYATMENMSEATDHVERSVKILEKIFGVLSVEMCSEYVKLACLLFNNSESLERCSERILLVIDRSLELLAMFDNHEMRRKMQKMKSLVVNSSKSVQFCFAE